MTVEYDGTGYSGWQRQANAMTVQQVIEEKLAALTGESIVICGASRTDAGVHAMGQSLHFDTHSRIPGEKFSYALNTLLPPDIRIRASTESDMSFHARFSAVGKRYRYLFYDAPHAGALNRNTHAHCIYPLKDQLMEQCIADLIGTYDFSAFAASGSKVRDSVRTIWSARVERIDHDVAITVEGSGFLYNMVRIIAGTLRDVGAGKLAPDVFKRALRSGDRLDLGITAPAHGLTLMEVFYRLPESCSIPVPDKESLL